MRKVFFFGTAVLLAAGLTAAWIWLLLVPAQPQIVQAGQTVEIENTTWHLDLLREVTLDDEALSDSVIDEIDGATYILAQFTFSGTEPLPYCSGTLLGADREWTWQTVYPLSDAMSSNCADSTAATVQMVFTIPPTAVGEISGVELRFGDSLIRLDGRVS